MFRKILLPLDGSQHSQYAIPAAVSLTQGNPDREVILLRVPTRPNLPVLVLKELAGIEQDRESRAAQCRNYLRYIRQIHMGTGASMRTVVEEGDPAAVIVDTAVAEKADLIVMSTHGLTGVSRWILGSVTQKVLQAAPCPVLVVRNSHPIERILITLDGSKLAEQAIQPGFELAKQLAGRVTLLKVLEPVTDVSEAAVQRAKQVAGTLDNYLINIHQQADDYLAHLIPADMSQIQVDTHVIENSTVAEGILQFVEDKRIDLIVMTTHGFTGHQRWMYGSVTEKVIQGAKCAMMIVRPPEN